MYTLEVPSRGARGDCFCGDGVDFRGRGESARGMGVGEGKSWTVANPRRSSKGASISQGQCILNLFVCM